MTLRVVILRFDRLAPLPDDVEEIALELRHARVDVRELASRAKLREDAMRRVETVQGVAIAPLPAVQIGFRLGGLRKQEQIVAPLRDVLRLAEMLLGRGEGAPPPPGDPLPLLGAAPPPRLPPPPRQAR